ncbi:MAG: TIGR04211 family SH3 domain-containing protein [Magnetococcales bacterium]|nr:TIGR04211 family SH3 domain-containing protein [Magnetococcales bacterium]
MMIKPSTLSQKTAFGWLAVILILTLWLPQKLLAETDTTPQSEPEKIIRYVTDQFRITMRKGPEATFRVVKVIPTGTRLELLEKGSNGWDLVRTRRGLEGWVLRRFLIDAPPARERMEEAEKLREEALIERDRLQEELASLKTRLQSQEALEAELNQITSASNEALTLREDYADLNQRFKNITAELKQVTLEKENLEGRSDTLFLLAGAGVLILGFIGGAMQGRRRRTYDTL